MNEANKESFKDNKIPDLNSEIINAIKNQEIILFVGAGISAQFKYPLWGELGRQLVATCKDQGIINSEEESILLNSGYNDLQLVTVATSLLDKKSNGNGLNEIIKRLNKRVPKNKKDALEIIASSLGAFRCPVLTTNADLSLDKSGYFDSNIYHSLDESNLEMGYTGLIHIHGSIKQPKNMIFTASQYAQKYTPDDDFGKMLYTLFNINNHKIILFIGYGFNEFELIRYFIYSKDPKNKRKMYILKDYYSYEEIKYKLDCEYYKQFNMEVIKYIKDDKGYDALQDVLFHWKTTIEQNTMAHIVPSTYMEKLFKRKQSKNYYHLSQAERNEVKRIYKDTDNDLQFINEIDEITNIDFFVEDLNNCTDLFSVKKKMKSPEEQLDGSIQYPSWPGLFFLLKICDRNNLNDDFIIKTIKKSVKIIKEDSTANKKYHIIDNSNVMDTLLKLILKKEVYIKSVDLPWFIDIYSSKSPFKAYYASLYLDKNWEIVNHLEKRDIFNIYSYLLKYVREEGFYNEYLLSNHIENFIKKCPNIYYEISKDELLKCDEFRFYSVGSLISYKSEYSSKDIAVYLDWIKKAIPYMKQDYLKKEIIKCLKIENRVGNKLAILISELNYSSGREVLWNKNVFNIKYIYLDLVHLIDNCDIEEDKEIITKLINEADFQQKDLKKRKLLRDNLLIRMGKYMKTPNKAFFNEQEKEFVDNYGKVYYNNMASFEKENYIFKKIKNAKYEDIPKIKEELASKKIPFFEMQWGRAFIHYLLNNNGIILKNNLDEVSSQFDSSFITDLNYSIFENEKIDNELKFKYIQKVIPKINYSDANNVKSYIFLIGKLSEHNYNAIELFDLLSEIDYDKIIDADYNSPLDFVLLINSTSFDYAEQYIKLSHKIHANYNNTILKLTQSQREGTKATLAYYYYYLADLTDFNGEDLIARIIPNKKDNYILVYDCLTYLGNIPTTLLSRLIKTKTYKNFLISNMDDNKQIIICHINQILYSYITKGNYLNILTDAIQNLDLSGIELILDCIEDNSKQILNNSYNNSRFSELLMIINSTIISLEDENTVNYYSFPRIMNCIESYDGMIDELWIIAENITSLFKICLFEDDAEKLIKYKTLNEDIVYKITINLFKNAHYDYNYEDKGIISLYNHYANKNDTEKIDKLSILLTKRNTKYKSIIR